MSYFKGTWRADYFKPHQEGPIFVDPDAVAELQDDVDTFLAGADRDTEAAVAEQNVRDMAEASFREWMRRQIDTSRNNGA